MEPFTIRPLQREDRQWVAHFLDQHWGSTQIVSRGELYYGHLLDGLVAERSTEGSSERIGLLTYKVTGKSCEIITLNSVEEGQGVATSLVDHLKEQMKAAGVTRLWLITTNDNLRALRFWQRRGFVLVAVHRDAIAAARRLKPQIPLVGHDGIPIRDEIELECKL